MEVQTKRPNKPTIEQSLRELLPTAAEYCKMIVFSPDSADIPVAQRKDKGNGGKQRCCSAQAMGC